MYLIPIVESPLKNSEKYNLTRCSIFLERNGGACISVESLDAAKLYLAHNEIFLLSNPIVAGNLIFAAVDPIKTDLSAFYTMSEVLPATLPMREVWRHFIWNDTDVDTWGTNVHLHLVECTPYSAGHLLFTYFKTSRVV
jgi:hypothetical protein